MNQKNNRKEALPGPVRDRRDFLKTILGGSILSAAALSSLNAGTYQSILELNQEHIADESPDGPYWEAIRRHYLFKDGLIMMNNGTVGPMPKPVFRTLMTSFEVQAANPYDFYNYFPGKMQEVRDTLARFINASPAEVAILRNTTEGMNFVAHGLDLKSGDEVLMSTLEHPGGIHPWKLKAKRYGITVREVPITTPPASVDEIVSAFRAAITAKTRIISISHTVFITGLITPLREICRMAHDHNLLVVADAAHALGMLKLDMKNLEVDFYTSSPYKWLGAPAGSGLFFARQDMQDQLWPTIATSGWDSYKTAKRFETLSQRADPLFFALKEALEFQKVIGRERIERRIKTLAGYLKKGLKDIRGVRLHTPMDPYLSGGLTAFSIKGVAPGRIVDFVREKYNIVIRTIGREKDNTAGVRVSTHIFVSLKDVNQLLEGVAYLAKLGK